MKTHNWFFAALWAFVFYILVCLIDLVIYKFNMIPHCGFQEYSLPEKTFMSLLILISMIISVLVLKRGNAKSFVVKTGSFWLLSVVLCHLVNIPFWVSLYIRGFETFAFGPNWLRQDIWFNAYCGAFIGTIIAGIVSYLGYRKKKFHQSINS